MTPIDIDFKSIGPSSGAVLVLGCGRSGTNMVLEVLRGSPRYNSPLGNRAEDRSFFQTYTTAPVPIAYLTKNVTAYIQNFNQIEQVLVTNPTLKIVWTVRDPRSLALSKIYRGRGHRHGAITDASYEGCVRDIAHMRDLHHQTATQFPGRSYVVKMEDLILDLDGTIAGICEFCEIPVSPQMRDFIPRYRTPDKAARYKTLDNGEVDIHKRVNEIYGGYFAGNGWRDPSWGDVTIESLWAALRPCVEYFGYDCDNQ